MTKNSLIKRFVEIPSAELIACSRAFNNSVVDFNGKTYMFYRYECGTDYKSDIAYCELDSGFNAIPGTSRRLQMPRRSAKVSTCDDPRAFVWKNSLWVMHNQGAVFREPNNNWSWATAVVLARVSDITNSLSQESYLPIFGSNLNIVTAPEGWAGEERQQIRSEKNWTPFLSGDNLHFAYKLNPLEVISYTPANNHNDPAQNICKQVSSTRFDQTPWKWGGFLAGSTPFQLVNGEYFGFFHSHINDGSGLPNCRTYYTGALAFSASAPYRVTRISKAPVVSAEMDHAHDLRGSQNTWRPNVIFPCGYVIRGDALFLSAGWQDCRARVYELSLSAIQKNMIPVRTLEGIYA